MLSSVKDQANITQLRDELSTAEQKATKVTSERDHLLEKLAVLKNQLLDQESDNDYKGQLQSMLS